MFPIYRSIYLSGLIFVSGLDFSRLDCKGVEISVNHLFHSMEMNFMRGSDF